MILNYVKWLCTIITTVVAWYVAYNGQYDRIFFSSTPRKSPKTYAILKLKHFLIKVLILVGCCRHIDQTQEKETNWWNRAGS